MYVKTVISVRPDTELIRLAVIFVADRPETIKQDPTNPELSKQLFIMQ